MIMCIYICDNDHYFQNNYIKQLELITADDCIPHINDYPLISHWYPFITGLPLRSGSEIVDEMGNVVSGGLSSTGARKHRRVMW